MQLSVQQSALRAAAILVAMSAGAVRAGTIDRSTVTFGFGTGYSAVYTQTSSTVDDRTMLNGPGYLDTFFNVLPSGNSNLYTVSVAVKNLTANAVTHYHFQLGVTNQNYYNTLDTDGDSIPDALDNDQDGDGLANAMDNAPFVFNPSQIDDDGDGWGNAIDLRPLDAGTPLNFLGSAKTAPFLVAPGSIPVSSSAVGLAYTGTLSSDTFANHMFVGTDLVFDTGSLAPDGVANFTLNIVVPDGLENDGFVLRQFVEPSVPEPASIASAAVVIALAGLRRRRSRTGT